MQHADPDMQCILTTLYAPPDVAFAATAWGANCGPAALAAVLRVPVERVRRLFPDFATKPYVNPSTMWTALRLAGRRGQKTGSAWPISGLGFVQWDGPWTAPGVPPMVAYRYTHWVGYALTPHDGPMVYDVNAWQTDTLPGDWVPLAWWEAEIVPCITQTLPRAAGTYYVRWGCEVPPASPRLPESVGHGGRKESELC